ncbi:hypothetical protein DFH28DRAFT_1119726 [Melampsora americana]|nr:hypothetical protein DFH28DRAFT_1119726 [Melampsora americana]
MLAVGEHFETSKSCIIVCLVYMNFDLGSAEIYEPSYGTESRSPQWGQSNPAKSKKQTSANKHKGAEKQTNPSTPTPLPKVYSATNRPTAKEQNNKAVSHMDPGLTPASGGNESQAPQQGESNSESAPTDGARDIPVSTSDPMNAVADADDEATSAREQSTTESNDGHDNNRKHDEGGVGSREKDEVEVNKQSVIKSLSFKKKSKKEEVDENLSEKQKVRAVKIKEAREQYDEVRAIHDDLCKSIKKLEERAKGGAIDKSVYILKRTCNKINQEMIEKEEELLMALTSDHPDVIFVPMVFDTSAPTEARTPIDLGSSPPPTQSTKPAPVVKVTKRQQSSVEPEGEKKRRKMRASDYVLDEAKECNSEASKEVLGKRQARRPPYKSPKFVDPEDMEVEGEQEDGDMVYAEPLGKGKKRAGKEATVEEDDLAAQNNRAAAVNAQRAALQQPRRPSPLNRELRWLVGVKRTPTA